jgi:hypothetical protein
MTNEDFEIPGLEYSSVEIRKDPNSKSPMQHALRHQCRIYEGSPVRDLSALAAVMHEKWLCGTAVFISTVPRWSPVCVLMP